VLQPPAAQEDVTTEVEQPMADGMHAPLHDVKPAEQTVPHEPPEQVGMAFWSVAAQSLPHIPQFMGSTAVSTHVPLHGVGAFAAQLSTSGGGSVASGVETFSGDPSVSAPLDGAMASLGTLASPHRPLQLVYWLSPAIALQAGSAITNVTPAKKSTNRPTFSECFTSNQETIPGRSLPRRSGWRSRAQLTSNQ
jgi:hypothetical protein